MLNTAKCSRFIFNQSNNFYSQVLLRVPFYSIEFDGNENTSGSAPSSSISVNGGSFTIAAKANDFYKLHHSFMGWGKNPNNSEELFQPGQIVNGISSNLRLYANWKELSKFELKFQSNGVLIKSPNATTIWEDSSDRAPDVNTSNIAKGFDFLSWNTEPNGKGLTITPGQNISSFYFGNKLSGNLTVYAIGKKIPLQLKDTSNNRMTIICVKGKIIKKVTAIKPKCPIGFVVK